MMTAILVIDDENEEGSNDYDEENTTIPEQEQEQPQDKNKNKSFSTNPKPTKLLSVLQAKTVHKGHIKVIGKIVTTSEMYVLHYELGPELSR